jgi:TatA/E family protein of Tat protein translocase
MSGGEILILLLVVLLALGAHRLPEAGRMVGKGLRDFHRARHEARGALADQRDPPSAPARRQRLID